MRGSLVVDFDDHEMRARASARGRAGADAERRVGVRQQALETHPVRVSSHGTHRAGAAKAAWFREVGRASGAHQM
jgi:hypothetical protein